VLNVSAPLTSEKIVSVSVAMLSSLSVISAETSLKLKHKHNKKVTEKPWPVPVKL
jgi:hypothetical protein